MPIDFTFTPRQRELQRRSRKFADDVLVPIRQVSDYRPTPEERFLATRPAYEAMVSEGYLMTCIPETVGGENTSLLDTAIVAEEFYARNPSVALTLIGTVLGLMPVVVGGTTDQRKRLLSPFLTRAGTPLAAFCSTEPGGSANAASPSPAEGVRTVAVRDGDHWTINGRKKWVSVATGWQREGADLLCVVCRTDTDAPPEAAVSVIALQQPAAGVVLDRAIDSIGHRSHLLSEFSFHDSTAPHANLLGTEGAGLQLVGASFASASALVGLLGASLMRSAFEFTLEFARHERRGGAAPIIEHQAVGYALADAKMTIEAARSLGWRACRAVDVQHPAALELADYAKIFGSESSVRVITDLMRVVGVESYETAGPLHGLLQDALALPIFSGGNLGVRRRQLHSLFTTDAYDPRQAGDPVADWTSGPTTAPEDPARPSTDQTHRRRTP